MCKYVDIEKKISKMKSGKDVVPLRLISEMKKSETSRITDLINPIIVELVIPVEELSTTVNYTMQENEML